MLTELRVSAAAEGAGLGPAGVIISALESPGPSARVAAGRDFVAASMIKVPIAAALLAARAEGRVALSDRLAVTANVMTENDAASPLVLGYEATLEELMRLMIVRSDNVATNALIEFLDRRWITERLRRLGLEQTVVRRKLTGGDVPVHDPGAEGRNSHPPEDAATLFRLVAGHAFDGAAELYAVLQAQEWNDKLSAGLLPGDTFAHKTGDTSEASHDGGILRTREGRRYVIVVYTALPSSRESDARLGDFMARIRPAL